MSAPVISAQRLTRAFGQRRAVDDVSLNLDAGDCLALFGPNGAGKTTLLRLMGGLLRPTGGEVKIDGFEPGGLEVRARVGILSHNSMLYDALTAFENVHFSASLYGLPEPARASEEVLRKMGAWGYAHVPIKILSRGMLQRVSIARALVHRPTIILADEPFTGLDAAGAAILSGLFSDVRSEGATLVIVTHNLDEALSLCTHAAIMRHGRIVRFDTAPVPEVAEYTALYREIAVDAS